MNRRRFLQALSVVSTDSLFAGDVFSSAPLTTDTRLATPAPAANDGDDKEPRIGVIAVGGAGGKVLSSLYGNLPHLDRAVAIDTDPVALHGVTADRKLLIADTDPVWRSGLEKIKVGYGVQTQIADAVAHLDIAFIVAGMGGRAGTSLAPLVAEVLMDNSVITIGTAITPFHGEGPQRQQMAIAGVDALRRITNLTFPLSNELLARSAQRKRMKRPSATGMFDRLYRGAILPITGPGLITWDPDLISLLISKVGDAAIGYGNASGEDAHVVATRQAIAHALLGKCRLRSASGIVFSVEGASANFSRLGHFSKIMETVRDTLGEQDHEQFLCGGVSWNEALGNEVRVTILAGGVQPIRRSPRPVPS